MTTVLPDAPDVAPTKQRIWDRHRRLAIAVAVLAIVAVMVVTDLPTSTSRASDISAERSVMSELNTDVSPCAYAIDQALGIWRLAAAHQLERGRPGADAGAVG